MNDEVRTIVESYDDKAGHTVKVGDFIVYGHALGRCAALKFGKVLKIETVKTWRDEIEWRIGVRGVEEQRWCGKIELSRPGTLMFPERTILANDFIPQAYKDLLDERLDSR